MGCIAAALLLLLPAPAVQEAKPTLPAPLAWLEDRDDYPLVSRRLMLLEPGAEEPREVLAPLLYSFDAADHQAVGWLGELLVVSGPVKSSRPTPNVPLPLQLLPTDGGPRDTVSGINVEHFYPSPDGGVLLTLEFNSLAYVVPDENGPSLQVLLDEEHLLGRSQLESAVWTADGRAVLVAVRGRRDHMQGGLWRIPFIPAAGYAPLSFGTPKRIDDGPARPREASGDGSVLATERVQRKRYTPHEALRAWPGTDREMEVLADDLHWNQAAALEPFLLGRSDRAPGSLVFAYVRFGDGALVLRAIDAEGERSDRILWKGPHAPESVAWSPDGLWLAFGARDEERDPWVWVLEVEGGAAHRLAPGLRPAWGPSASKR